MSWLQQLYETYENAQADADSTLWPVSHFMKNAHIEVVIDSKGNYQKGRTRCLSGEDAATLIPATESSAGRSGAKIAPHPLCEELGYCAEDLPKAKLAKFEAYQSQLTKWCESENTHAKAEAVLAYISKKTVWADISKEVDFPITFKNKSGQATKIEAEKAFIRWKIEVPGEPCSSTWEDGDLIQEWIKHDASVNSKMGFCNVLGKQQVRIASNHSRFIRYAGDGAKIISSNDTSGYTFRGKFYESEQACSVSFDVTQKAHNALRWLVTRQGYRNDDQVFISWAVSTGEIPDPFADSHTLLGTEPEEVEAAGISDVGQAFAKRLSKKIAGYQANITDTSNIIVMGLDSATPGRMAITFYRELERSEFLMCIEQWHTQFAWHQDFGKNVKFVGTPAPKDIAEAAYGRWDEKLKKVIVDEKVKKVTVERLLPCIIDYRSFPKDLMNSTIQRVSNRVGMSVEMWEKTLGIACSLFRGTHQQENYRMSLEEDRTTRDYLYGRLLAVADYIEEVSLSDSEKNRQTNAARFMQRFASNPYKTWPMLYDQLTPYIARLKANRKGLWIKLENLLDDIKCKFTAEIFTDNAQLSGEYLLAYHCQRKELWKKIEKDTATD